MIGKDAEKATIVYAIIIFVLKSEHQSVTLTTGPGPEASENLTRTSEIYIKLLRPTVPGPVKKNPNFAHWNIVFTFQLFLTVI